MKKKTIFVIFGATGDLMKRKLIPALFCLSKEKKFNQEFEVLAIGRKEIKNSSYQDEFIIPSINQFSSCYEKEDLKNFSKKFDYVQVDYNEPKSFNKIKTKIDKLATDFKTQVIYYLSLPPNLFPKTIENIKLSNLHVQDKIEKKIAFEKPFGDNLKNAIKLNDLISTAFLEKDIYRIDHYLGKDAVQNFLVLRFANHFLEPLWNHRHIDNIQITASEKIGVGSRAGYYDESGALKDMVQNHLFQMLSLIAMEPPSTLDADDIRNEKVKIFENIKNIDNETLMNNVVFGQYDKGIIDNEKVKSYLDEDGISKKSRTETFVALKLEIDNFRWSGVPFYLRTGKRLKDKGTLIVVEFKKVPNILYNKKGDLESNKLIIKIQPDESIEMEFNIKAPNSNNINSIKSEFDHKSYFKLNSPEAYENIFLSIINSDQTLFTRWDGVKKSWEIVDNLVECHDNCPIVHKYVSGSWGPEMADKLLAKDNRKWWNL